MQQKLIAGDSLNFLTTVSEFLPTDGYILKYRLAPRTAGGTVIDLTATAEGSSYRVQAGAATTANWSADTYSWACWVEKAGEVYTVGSGTIQVLPNPRTAVAGVDRRSQAEVSLAAVQALLAGKASSGVESYEINGRQLKSYPLADLLKLERKLKNEVNAEAIAAGNPAPYASAGIRRILTRVVA